jgi:ABC-type multidrug transport system ATPase subunit
LSISTSHQPQPPATDAAPPAVEITRASYRYDGHPALDHVSLSVPAGAIFGLLGPNGSGKSTLLSLLIGRREPAEGELRVLGEPLSAALRARIGIVFQEPSLDPLMTVRETMLLHGRLFGLSRAAAVAPATRLLARVALADRAGAFTSTLSGGMKRRLELARALLTSPDVLLLDEPTLALDPDSKQALWQYLLDVNAAGATLLLATNDVYEAERYCHTVALLDEGRIIAQGAPAELKRDLRRDAVRIEWKDDAAARADLLRSWEGVGSVRLAGATAHITVDAASAFLTRVFQEYGEHIHGVQIEGSTLEDVYFQLVGRGITHTQAAP